jgi:hypothetical protein
MPQYPAIFLDSFPYAVLKYLQKRFISHIVVKAYVIGSEITISAYSQHWTLPVSLADGTDGNELLQIDSRRGLVTSWLTHNSSRNRWNSRTCFKYSSTCNKDLWFRYSALITESSASLVRIRPLQRINLYTHTNTFTAHGLYCAAWWICVCVSLS